MLVFRIFVLADTATSITLPLLAEQLRIRPHLQHHLKIQDLHFENFTGQLRHWFGQTPQSAEPFRSCAAPPEHCLRAEIECAVL